MFGPANEETPGVEAMETGAKRTGAMLAAARAAAGIELADIAKETRVPLRHLRALERDDHEAMPALPYAIGFVKAFARAVGLDPEAIAVQFRAETSKIAHSPSPVTLEPLDERRLPSGALVAASLAAVVLVVAALSAWGAGWFDPAPPAAPETAAAAPVAEVSAPAAAPALSDDTSVTSAPASPGEVTATPLQAADQTTASPAVTTPVSAAMPGGSVVLAAKEDVWIKVYDRATRTNVRMGILKAGESYIVPGDQPGLMLWTGKAGALAVTIAGKAIPPLGGPVQTVRDVSLAPADLLARAPNPGSVM
jgi:cytoskeletal protein RodZ